MPIYVSYDENNKTESVILARTKDAAIAYWQGAGISMCVTKEFMEQQIEDFPLAVLPLVKTEMKLMRTARNTISKPFRIVV